MKLSSYSIGVGDRFGQQIKAQLEAIRKMQAHGVNVTPVWNKSYREHTIINSKPADLRKLVDEAILATNWKHDYFVDADHVNMKIVDQFIDSSDFFTIDVADFIGKKAEVYSITKFVRQHKNYMGTLTLPGIDHGFKLSEKQVEAIAWHYLFAIEEAGRIYRFISEKKQNQPFIVEVSMDEANQPQTPVEMFFILAAIAQEKIPIQTIAPKFTGRFNKGVDYVGDLNQFTKEFEEHLSVIAAAISEFGLPSDLKLSIHSGSDKFALYGVMNRAIKKHHTGLHLKTAGTTWLEEVIGLAEADGEGLAIAREIYRQAYSRCEELCQPYAAVIDIDVTRLPAPHAVDAWDGTRFASALRHDPGNSYFNPHFRQLLHVAYKIAAEMGTRYLDALEQYSPAIGKNVTYNIYERHLKQLFL